MLQSSWCGFGGFKEKVTLKLIFKEVISVGEMDVELVPQNGGKKKKQPTQKWYKHTGYK